MRRLLPLALGVAVDSDDSERTGRPAFAGVDWSCTVSESAQVGVQVDERGIVVDFERTEAGSI